MLSVLSLSLLTLVLLTSFGYATATQWFPAASNENQYKVSCQLTFSNQTVIQTDTFDVYQSFSYVYLMPTSLNFYGRPQSWTSRENATTLTLRHTYYENTTTQLRRANTLWGQVTNYTNIEVRPVVAWNGTYYGISGKNLILSNDNLFPKSDYATTDGGDFVDYLPNYLGLGQTSFTGFNIIGSSGEITYHLSNSSSLSQIYASDATGKVTSFTIGTISNGLLDNTNLYSISYYFELTSGIPAYPVAVLITVAGVATVSLIWSMKRQRKLNQ